MGLDKQLEAKLREKQGFLNRTIIGKRVQRKKWKQKLKKKKVQVLPFKQDTIIIIDIIRKC